MAAPFDVTPMFSLRLSADPAKGNPRASSRNPTSASDVKSAGALQTACREMESLFISYLLQEMRATVNKSGLISGGPAEDLYTFMLDAELARKIAQRGGIGLANILQNQLEKRSLPTGQGEPQK
ncbi:MAG: rod-binding protein [Desulfobacterales bacterium]|nr:MAG: rod-binding protein [Desulfobacterales bacterium]